MTLDEKKQTAQRWFRELRDTICTNFEAIEAEYAALANDAKGAGPMLYEHGNCVDSELGERANSPRSGAERSPAGDLAEQTIIFTKTPWARPEGGGGEIGIMKGRVFEKVGVNISTVHGEFSEQFRHEIPGAAENPNFWATGISLVAHMASPLIPAAHFNTRMIIVGDGARIWFGGGGDLNPMFPIEADTDYFHAAFKTVCDELGNAGTAQRSSVDDLAEQHNYYQAFKAWCDEYFYIPHRGEARGVGGIFYDYLGLNKLGADTSAVTSGRFGKGGRDGDFTRAGMEAAANANIDWNAGLAFTQAVGHAFNEAYGTLIRRHLHESWTAEQRHHQLKKRGRYAEYNLLYDRGTRFGLMTGGNPEAILMSLPPVAIWE